MNLNYDENNNNYTNINNKNYNENNNIEENNSKNGGDYNEEKNSSKTLLFNKIYKVNKSNQNSRDNNKTVFDNYQNFKNKPFDNNNNLKLRKIRPYMQNREIDGASFRKQGLNKLKKNRNKSALDLKKLGIDFYRKSKNKEEVKDENNNTSYMNNKKFYKVKVLNPNYLRYVDEKAVH